jgi:hypothetical protein
MLLEGSALGNDALLIFNLQLVVGLGLGFAPHPPRAASKWKHRGAAITAPIYETSARHLSYSHPHALQAFSAECYDRSDPTAPR